MFKITGHISSFRLCSVVYYANLLSKTSCSKVCVKFPIGPFCLGNGAYLDVMNLCVLSILIKSELLTKS